MALSSHHLIRYTTSSPAPAASKLDRSFCSRHINFSANAKGVPGGGGGRRVWRRRKLMKKDEMLKSLVERVPFLEEQVRNIRDNGEVMCMDIEKLMRAQENRFDFVNEVAAEATAYLENNRDEYGAKKPILHVISNRMNEAGFYRTEAYLEPDPFKPGPNFLKEELYD